MSLLDRQSQRLAWPDKLTLTDKFVEISRSETAGKRFHTVSTNVSQRAEWRSYLADLVGHLRGSALCPLCLLCDLCVKPLSKKMGAGPTRSSTSPISSF